jgi:hypothetical protein
MQQTEKGECENSHFREFEGWRNLPLLEMQPELQRLMEETAFLL